MVSLVGCDAGIQNMGATEYGVVFRKIPRFLGGGVSGPTSVAAPLETVIVMPWSEIYRFDTAPQYLSWGKGMGDGGTLYFHVQDEDMHTRVKDGNQADLKVTARYRLKPDPASLVKLAQEVSTTSEGVREFVIAAIQSDIRTFMNRLRTPEFRNDKKRNEAADAALASVQQRLGSIGVEVESLIVPAYRFVRQLPNDTEDTSYQDRLRDIQAMEQDIEGERSRVETVRAKKKKELLEAQSVYNSQIAEAEGYKSQAVYQGDAYFASRANEAKAILAEGQSEVDGLKQQVAALSGKGGRAMLRLEVARQLAKGSPRFIALGGNSNPASGPGAAAGLSLSKTDLNQLLEQLGVVEGLSNNATTKGVASEKNQIDTSLAIAASQSAAGSASNVQEKPNDHQPRR